jgi:hypothetical protein
LKHRWRILDQHIEGISGINAATGKPETKPIWDAANKEVVQPVLLDGSGIPKNAGYTVSGTAGIGLVKLNGYELEPGDDAAWLLYKKCKSLPFAGLGVF